MHFSAQSFLPVVICLQALFSEVPMVLYHMTPCFLSLSHLACLILFAICLFCVQGCAVGWFQPAFPDCFRTDMRFEPGALTRKVLSAHQKLEQMWMHEPDGKIKVNPGIAGTDPTQPYNIKVDNMLWGRLLYDPLPIKQFYERFLVSSISRDCTSC